MKAPLRTVREAVEIIRRQIAREKGSYEGKLFKTSAGARFNFRVNDPVPIYIGAQGPKMLQLAGAIGDGALINASHPDDIERAVKLIVKGAEKAVLPQIVIACLSGEETELKAFPDDICDVQNLIALLRPTRVEAEVGSPAK